MTEFAAPGAAGIYADHNAGSPVRPEAVEAVAAALRTGGNPSSVHGAGRRGRAVLEDARETLAASLGARAQDVVFTSGGTEADNLALASMAAAGVRRFFVSSIEHDAVREAVRQLGVAVEWIPVTPGGVVQVSWLAQRLANWDGERDGPPGVAVMWANNETGVRQPITEIGALVRDAGGLLLVDAVQGLGRDGVTVAALSADYLAVSAHKIGGPPGVGALATRPGAPLSRTLHGGGQEQGRRGGTQNVAGVAGFAAALTVLQNDDGLQERLGVWRDALEERLRQARPDVVIFGADAPRLPNTSCFGLAGFSSELQVMALDMEGVAVSAGAACSSGKVRASHVLEAMHVPGDLAGCAIRVSLGWTSTADDVDAIVDVWTRAAARACPAAA